MGIPRFAAVRNQTATGRVGHAYLFTGVRGTGKTTCAKIFAKAVNCLHPQNGDPCGECEICKGIDNGSILDVVEMDAASNNGVDDIRDLRDETAYTPSACQYKVYIIDEVHMLSTAAFNALLKTLEEPPAHVIFILATTEIQKVPATILSRCQRYDFTRIGPEDIAQRVEYIAGEEHLELTSDGAELIARLADGALRDALSILDTCAGVTAKIDADVVRRMAGVTDRSYLFHISNALEAQDGAAALAQLAQLRQQSVDVKRLTEELIAHYRALMLAALPGGQALLSGVSPEEEAQYLEKGPQLSQREAIRAIRTLGTALEHMTRGSDQRIELELALFSLSEPPQQCDCRRLVEVTLAEGLTELGNSMFLDCVSLQAVTIPDSVSQIGESTFSGCTDLQHVTLPQNLKQIGGNAFRNCSSLTVVAFPEKLKSIGNEAFSGCSGLQEALLPDTTDTLGYSVFYGCTSLERVRLSDEITELGQTVFRQCKKLPEITLPKNLTTIGESTFFSCDGFTRVEIPDGTQRIGSNAFSYCTNLKEVVIPKSVTQIGGAFESFAGCDSLTDVYYAGSEEDWNKIRFCTTLDKILKVRIHFNGGSSASTTTPAETTTAPETTTTTTVTTATEPEARTLR